MNSEKTLTFGQWLSAVRQCRNGIQVRRMDIARRMYENGCKPEDYRERTQGNNDR